VTGDGEIAPEALRGRVAAGDPLAILDVREAWEHAICALPGARLIPIEELPFRADELDPARETVVYCHHGVRSAAAAQWLRQLGFPAVSLRGGIDAWTLAVDPSLRRY
jgi:rhodanese-related sulfurtransferase